MGFVKNAIRHVLGGGGGGGVYIEPPRLTAREILGNTDLRSQTPEEVGIGTNERRKKRGRRALTVEMNQNNQGGSGLNI